MGNKMVKDFRLVAKASPTPNQEMEECAIFTAAGSPVTLLTGSNVATATTDVGAVTSVVAAGATPTKAEYDALRVDALATRTKLNTLLANLRTAGLVAP